MRYYLNRNRALIGETNININGVSERCVIIVSETNITGSSFLILKRNESPIKTSLDTKVEEIDILDSMFNADINNTLKMILENFEKVVSIDCGQDQQGVEYESRYFDKYDKELIKMFIEDMESIGISITNKALLKAKGD